MAVGRLALGLVIAALSARAATVAPSDPSPSSVPATTTPDRLVVREARYRMSAAIRPLYVFWIRASNVGAGRIVWRSGREGPGYELLIGSDPDRAPRRINRWGFEREDLGPEGVSLFGLMRKTDEDSLDEAKEGLRTEGQGGFVYKAIHAQVSGGRVRAENTLWRMPKDLTYRDLPELEALVRSPGGSPPKVREASLPWGTHGGFLFAAAHVIDAALAAAGSSPRRLLADFRVTFTFNASLYDLRLRSTEWLESATYGDRRYERLLRLDCEHLNREKRTRERFVLVCPTEGPLRGVPVFIEYQPKWWFRAQGVLDESEAFP